MRWNPRSRTSLASRSSRSLLCAVVLTIGLVACTLIASTFIVAQSRNAAKEPERTEAAKTAAQPAAEGKNKSQPAKTAPALTSREVISRLQLEVDTQPFREPIKLGEFLRRIDETLEKNDRAVTINLDKEAFAREAPDAGDPFDADVAYTSTRKRAAVMDILSQVVRQIGKGSSFVVRAGRVDIVPLVCTSKEFTFNQTFRADFKEQRLDLALEELSDLTGVTLVRDARAKLKAQTLVSARFNDDVALQDAVRMLTDMAELKIVYLVTGMYITTPDRAAAMQKELRQLYEGEPKPMAPLVGPPNPLMEIPADPLSSPLAPPLPPAKFGRGKRLEAAG